MSGGGIKTDGSGTSRQNASHGSKHEMRASVRVCMRVRVRVRVRACACACARAWPIVWSRSTVGALIRYGAPTYTEHESSRRAGGGEFQRTSYGPTRESSLKSTASVDGGGWRPRTPPPATGVCSLVIAAPTVPTRRERRARGAECRRGRSCRASRCCSLQGQLRWRDGLHHQSQEP